MNRRETVEQSRMGFLGNGMNTHAPYNHIPVPEPIKNLPLINGQGSPATGEGASSANETGNGAATAAAN